MSHWTVFMVLSATLLGLCGCATRARQGVDPERARRIEQEFFHPDFRLSPELEERILALDPARVSGKDVEDVLAQAPAPRIIKIRGGINIRGGILPVYRRMLSFTEFLLGMGYPGLSLTNPADGSYAYSCYENSRKMAGLIAWYYEREGLRPIIVGHSQGGMQAIKILHRLAAQTSQPIPLWNPLTNQREEDREFTDPLTGAQRPVASLVLPYATAVGAGGLTRALPNQWEMNTKLRTIPDSVEEFTGFCKGLDLLGGDYLGYGPANHYRPNGRAKVRNVWLPEQYSHASIPETSHLAQDQAIKDWLNNYQPSPERVNSPKVDVSFDANSRNILWAAEVWYSIKKHWVLELQQYIRAKRAQRHES